MRSAVMHGQSTPQWKHRVLLLLAVSLLILPSKALEVHSHRKGETARLIFTQRVSPDSTYGYELYNLQSGAPFCENGTMIPHVLTPHQMARMDVDSSMNGGDLTVTLLIRDLQEVDGGVYVLSVSELNPDHADNGVTQRHVVDLYLTVTTPPGEANCVLTGSYSSKWLQVHCKAMVGSNGGGRLVCYQNSRRAPFIWDTTVSGDYLTAVYWLDRKRKMNCCSVEDDGQFDNHMIDACNDYVYP